MNKTTVKEAIKNINYFIITKDHKIIAGDTHTGFFTHPTTKQTKANVLKMNVLSIELFPPCLGECLINIKV